VAVLGVRGGTVTLFDPASGSRAISEPRAASEPRASASDPAVFKEKTISLEEFQSQWDGYLLRVWKPAG
jgi:hypothetical protein